MVDRFLANIAGQFVRHRGRRLFTNVAVNDAIKIVSPPVNKIPLYVHIPFCKSLCRFCCFNRYQFNENIARDYFSALSQEIKMYRDLGFDFSDVNIGGGTPTVMIDELTEVILLLKSEFNLGKISVETTPLELNDNNIQKLKSSDVNRLSVGIQSFDETLLKALGRHNIGKENVIDRLRLARGQFETLNIDFVFDFPGQSLEQFKADIAIFKELKIDQATFYPVMPSLKKRRKLKNKYFRTDGLNKKLFYDLLLNELSAKDYSPSTVWCFSRGTQLIDEYIVKHNDYIGVGAGSISSLHGSYSVNSFDVSSYQNLISKGNLPVIANYRLSRSDAYRSYLLTRLFGMKIDQKLLYQRFPFLGGTSLPAEIRALKAMGLIEVRDQILLTRKGMYYVSVMMREYFGAINDMREYFIEKKL